MELRLAGNCHPAYLKASLSIRRRFNEAVLDADSAKGPEDRPSGVHRGLRASVLSSAFE